MQRRSAVRTRFVPVALLALALAACTDATAPSSRESEGSLELYGGGLTLSIYESPGEVPGPEPGVFYSGGREPRIVLTLRTIAERWPCFGRLAVELAMGPGAIDLATKGVSHSNVPCTGWLGAGVFSEFLPLSVGTYTLRIDAAGKRDTYEVRVSDTAIELERTRGLLASHVLADGPVHPDRATFWRFPPRSLAAYCVAGSSGPPCAAVFDELAETLELTAHEFPPEGQRPFRPSHHPGDEVRFFRYADEEAVQELRDVVCALVPDSTGDASSRHLTVVTWTGDGASSWGSCQ